MCDLCVSDSKGRELIREHYLVFSKKLEQLSEDYKGLAYGRLYPHSEDGERIAKSVHSIIRELVETWI